MCVEPSIATSARPSARSVDLVRHEVRDDPAGAFAREKFIPMATLIFPSTVVEAHAQARRLRAGGGRVIGAASVPPNHAADTFDAWARLPTIYDDEFAGALASLVATHNINQLIAPSAAVHRALDRLREDGRLPCPLVGHSPIRAAMNEWADRSQRARDATAWLEQYVGERVDRPWVNAVLSIPALMHGASSEDKLLGLCAAALSAPDGDFVEIGTSMGRSAAVLALAARNRGRSLLTVDPFDEGHLVQHDVADSLNALMAEWSPKLVEEAFLAHLRLVTPGPFAHLREPSTAAAARYRNAAQFRTPGFDPVTARGCIALLHIDANHDFAAVDADWRAWSPHLTAGAWVVFDDYHWAHGDGPQRVGDGAYAATTQPGAFCMGGALFFRYGPITARSA